MANEKKQNPTAQGRTKTPGSMTEAEAAIKDVEQAMHGDSDEVNPRLRKVNEAPLDDRSAHIRVTADAADRDAHPDPDARTDIGASDDTYKRTRGLPG